MVVLLAMISDNNLSSSSNMSNKSSVESSDLSNISARARLDILKAAHSAGKKGAHIAPSLSDVDICLAVLQSFDETADSFILSKGHGALGYYAAMHQLGMITDEQFDSFETNGGEFPGQPSRSHNNHIEFSSGSLGMGLSYGLGVALAKKMQRTKSIKKIDEKTEQSKTGGTVYVLLGDGELNEGSNWEAATLASKYNLDNLVAIVDHNNLQSDGSNVTGQNLSALWNAHGWCVKECDGHSISSIRDVMNVEHSAKPLTILAKTIKGKGVPFMENNNAWHHAALKDDDYERAVQEIQATQDAREESQKSQGIKDSCVSGDRA